MTYDFILIDKLSMPLSTQKMANQIFEEIIPFYKHRMEQFLLYSILLPIGTIITVLVMPCDFIGLAQKV